MLDEPSTSSRSLCRPKPVTGPASLSLPRELLGSLARYPELLDLVVYSDHRRGYRPDHAERSILVSLYFNSVVLVISILAISTLEK